MMPALDSVRSFKQVTLDEAVGKDLELVEETFPSGEVILRQGKRCGLVFVLVSGAVEVIINGQLICQVEEKGAIFGELSALLEDYPNATVRTVKPSRFLVLNGGESFVAQLESDPGLAFCLLRMLAHRLALLTSCYADLLAKCAAAEDQVGNSYLPAPDYF